MSTTRPYTVKSGDTLSRIAEDHGLSWRGLYDLQENADFRAKRPDPQKIFVGDVINIPEKNVALRRLGMATESKASVAGKARMLWSPIKV